MACHLETKNDAINHIASLSNLRSYIPVLWLQSNWFQAEEFLDDNLLNSILNMLVIIQVMQKEPQVGVGVVGD